MPEPDAAEQKTPRKRLTVFYAKDAEPLGEDRMPTLGADTDAAMGALGAFARENINVGVGEKAVVLFSEPGDEGFSLAYVWFKSGYVLPPHSHNGDCLYCVIGGELRMGSHVLRKGDGMFIPRDHAYAYEAGPDGVEVLEFRNATRFNIHLKAQEGHWGKILDTYRERAAIWEAETIPPSDR